MVSILPDVKPVLLWTDALIYVLIATVIWAAGYTRSREHLLTPWREVLKKPLGMSALVVLVVYLVIGLDRLHSLQTSNWGRSQGTSPICRSDFGVFLMRLSRR